jgi:hypothetical protein
MDSNSAPIDVRAALLFRPGTDLHPHHAPDEDLCIEQARFSDILSEWLQEGAPLILRGRDILHFEVLEQSIHDRRAPIDPVFRGLVANLCGSERGFRVSVQVSPRTGVFAHRHADEYDVLHRVRHWTEDVGLAMYLAKPGAARRVRSEVHVGNTWGEATRDDGFDNLLRRGKKAGAWPQLRELPLSIVWRWLKASPSVETNFATDAVGRALHAASHTLYARSFVTDLVWVMVGLESLFTSSEGGLLHQVRERGQALLGSSGRASKDISEMYRIRSKFLHGKLGFPGPHYADYGGDEFRQWTGDMLQALATGRAMLIASLQELVVRDWHELEFGVSVAGR